MDGEITKLVDLDAIPPLDCSRSFEQLAHDAYEYWLDLQFDDGAPFEVFMSEPWQVLQNCYCVLVKDRTVDPLAHMKGKRGVGVLRYQLALRHAHEITTAYPQLLFEASKGFPELIGGQSHNGNDYVRQPLSYPHYEKGNAERRIQARRARQAVTLTIAPTPPSPASTPGPGFRSATLRLLFDSREAKSDANMLPALREPEQPRELSVEVSFASKQFDAFGRETFRIQDVKRMELCRETIDAVRARVAELDALGWQYVIGTYSLRVSKNLQRSNALCAVVRVTRDSVIRVSMDHAGVSPVRKTCASGEDAAGVLMEWARANAPIKSRR